LARYATDKQLPEAFLRSLGLRDESRCPVPVVPTGLIVTTAAASLHPENETCMLTVTIRDTAQQTNFVLRALADRANGHGRDPVDVTPWHALQE
jgi:hypothetical protein